MNVKGIFTLCSIDQVPSFATLFWGTPGHYLSMGNCSDLGDLKILADKAFHQVYHLFQTEVTGIHSMGLIRNL